MRSMASNPFSEPLRKGILLAARPELTDPLFSRAIILVCQHDSEGSLGFVVNRKTEYAISDVLPDFPNFSDALYAGGPVSPEQLFYLIRPSKNEAALEPIAQGLAWGARREYLEEVHASAEHRAAREMKFFVGYAGWGAGQLHREWVERSWYVLEQWKPADVFGEVEDLWASIVKRVLDRESRLIRGSRPELN